MNEQYRRDNRIPPIEADDTMNAPLHPEVLMGAQPADQPSLPLATEGVQRYVWESRFGNILIEVVGEQSFVNGERVEPMDPPPP